MSKLIAVLVVCLGTVSLWAGGNGSQSVPKQTQVGTSKNSGPTQQSGSSGRTDQPKRRPNLGGITPSGPPNAGTNFYGSGISQYAPNKSAPFLWIKPGTFQMGSIKEIDRDRNSDEEQHTVTLTRGFWLLDHEVTQSEYQSVMVTNPSYFKGDTLPVERVSWNDAVAFCEKLTKLDRSLKRIREDQAYRLPTEAEWEYAARAGTTGPRYTVDGLNVDDSLNEIAWWHDNSGSLLDRTTHAVKGKKANDWGLYDMIGNVWEWCLDWYGDYRTGAVTDPSGPSSGSKRVLRGGGWLSGADSLRSANRFGDVPNYRSSGLGFRPALSSVE